MVKHNTEQTRRDFVKTTVAGSAAAGLAGLAGCVGSGDEDPEAVGSVANLENSYWLSWQRGYEEACEAFGYKTNLQTNGGNVDQQQSQFDTAVSNMADMIVGQTYTNAAAISLAETCVQGGVPTILAVTIADWYTPLDAGPEYVQFFTPHFVNHAYTSAKVLFEEMGGEGSFVHIEGNRGTAPNTGRNAGLELALEEYPDIERLEPVLQGNFIRTDARDAMSDLISTHGDDIEGFFGQNDDVAIGGLQRLEEAGYDVPVVGIDATEPALERIRDGRMVGSVSGMGPWQAGWSVAKAHDFIQGYELTDAERMMSFNAPLVVNDPDEWSDRIGDEIELPIIEVDQYEADIFDGETPYDWELMSKAESGEDAWDPQIGMSPMGRADIEELLEWDDDDRSDDYSLPSVYDDDDELSTVQALYDEQFNSNPLE
ncbi:sugar ABC transporter substrate-binding protein [Natronorubrum bangense]|uniref:ABC transporter substrate-binding protein n=2 Tax=Natronorubrum bangense TaxID=61858 RepID=L9WMG7_9EURY|nr:sugar ABC transporter substrate-binding protein [Natronorubrum bangense]ELY49508.1 ABC transporter substrate-binding protein [Natronorubrum bangense JCM 10635]QCC56316.1 sugar ABC transporter substrate-binding protein [Natronorubrum bangense]